MLLDQYLYRCELFGLLSPDDKARMTGNLPKDPKVLRTLKIQRYQVEKEVKAKLKDIRSRLALARQRGAAANDEDYEEMDREHWVTMMKV